MEFLTNVLLEFVPTFIIITAIYAVLLSTKWFKKLFITKIYLALTVTILFFSMIGTDNSYKNTTGYDKALDVKTLEVIQNQKPVVIKDSTKPVMSDQERKAAFDEMVKYKEEN